MTIPLEPGRVYHIYNRGNNRENIFIEARNYRYFLRLYGHYITPIAETFAYCLLRNHFHLAVRIKDNVSALLASKQFGTFFGTYAKAINKAYPRTGTLFEGRFKRKQVNDEHHLTHLIAYIHHNPQHHGFIDDYREWPYSSYAALSGNQPTQLARQTALSWFGDQAQFIQFHQDVADWKQIATLIVSDFN